MPDAPETYFHVDALFAKQGEGWSCAGWAFSPVASNNGPVRAKAGPQVWFALIGLHRPDVAEQHVQHPSASSSGFQVSFSVCPREPVVLEMRDRAGQWHEFWREPLQHARKRGPRNWPALPSAFRQLIAEEMAGRSKAGGRKQRNRAARALIEDYTAQTVTPPLINFRMQLETPAGDRFGGRQLLISGWIVSLLAPVTRVLARTDTGEFFAIEYFRPRPDVSAAFSGREGTANCGFEGLINIPPHPSGWFLLQLHVELGNGTRAVVLSRRMARETSSMASHSVVSRWHSFLLACIALRHGYRLDSWRSWLREPVSLSWRSAQGSLESGRAVSFSETRDSDPIISILVPVFDPPERYLQEMVASVRAQLYPHWELCLADDASTAPHVRPLLAEFARQDSRIRVIHRSTNGQISRATNSALTLASGKFVALLDHDDLLTPPALLRVVEAIRSRSEVEFLYTDRDKVDDHGRHFDVELRGAWNPAMAMTHNYLHQLTVIRRDLVERVGGFREDLFGSQDLDLYLRLHEQILPRQILHVPVLAYHWRAHPGSTATRGDQKSYMFDSARRAIADALARRELRAKPFLPDFAQAFGLNLHQLRWSPQVLHEAGVSIVLVFDSADLRGVNNSLTQLTATIPARSIQLIVVTRSEVPIAHASPVIEFVVVANASGTAELFNRGAARARLPLLLLLDARASAGEPGWLEDLAGWLSVPQVDAAGPKLVTAAGKIHSAGWTIERASGLPSPVFAGLGIDEFGPLFQARTARDVLLLDPWCILTRTQRFQELGGYDFAGFPHHYAAADYCIRLRDAGGRSVFSPQAVLITATGADMEGANAAANESATFRKRHSHTRDPWLDPSTLETASHDPPGPRQTAPWMPVGTIAFDSGWFYLEDQRVEEESAGEPQRFHGWCIGLPGKTIIELRFRCDSMTIYPLHGFLRPDLGTQMNAVGKLTPVGFDLQPNLPHGAVTCAVEAHVFGAGWEPVTTVQLNMRRSARRALPLVDADEFLASLEIGFSQSPFGIRPAFQEHATEVGAGVCGRRYPAIAVAAVSRALGSQGRRAGYLRNCRPHRLAFSRGAFHPTRHRLV